MSADVSRQEKCCQHGVLGYEGDPVNVACPECLDGHPQVIAGWVVFAVDGQVVWIPVSTISYLVVIDLMSAVDIGGIPHDEIFMGQRVDTAHPHVLARAIAEADQ